MTEHIHDDGDLDQRLSDGLEALHSALDRILDHDAGVADATLPGRTDALDRDLDSALDLDAGLDAILSTRPATPPLEDQSASEESLSASALRRFADELIAQPAHQRLRVRTWLPRTQLDAVYALASLGHRTREDLRSHARTLARALDHARNRPRGHARELDLARALHHARELDRALNLVLDHARALDHARNRPRGHARELDLARALHHARELDRALNHVLDLDRALDYALVLARELDHVLDLDRALDHALDHALDSPFGRVVPYAFIAALARDRGGDEEVEHGLIAALEIMDNAVSDVVGADLNGADLRGIPLEGVRWSSATRWPSGWVERVRRVSVPIALDLWEIRGGGLSVDEFVPTT